MPLAQLIFTNSHLFTIIVADVSTETSVLISVHILITLALINSSPFKRYIKIQNMGMKVVSIIRHLVYATEMKIL